MRNRARSHPGRFAVVAASAMAAVLLVPGAAHACSCAFGEPRDRLADAEAAFVGTLIDRDAGLFSQRATFTFEVEHDIRGNLDERVEVVAEVQGSSCGIDFEEGARAAMFLFLEGDHWTSSLCSQIDPDELLAAAEPLPAPTGEGPIRLLVGGSFGEARVLALDRDGKTLAYGWGDGNVTDLDVCPGGRRAVEVVRGESASSLAVRDITTLAIVREIRLRAPRGFIDEAACLDERGRHLLVIDTVHPHVRVLDVVGRTQRIVYEFRGREWMAWIDGDAVFTKFDGVFGRVSTNGEFTPIVDMRPRMSNPVLSPDGAWVAVVLRGRRSEPATPSAIELIATDGAPGSSVQLGAWDDRGTLTWIDKDRLVFAPYRGDSLRIVLYAVPTLEEMAGGEGWMASETVTLASSAYGIAWDELLQIRLGVEHRATARPLDGPTFTIDVVPGHLDADPQPGPAIDITTVRGPAPRSSFGLLLAVFALAAFALAYLLNVRRRRGA